MDKRVKSEKEFKEDDPYGKMLKQYMKDLKRQESMQREAEKLDYFDSNFSAGYLDYIFPYHMLSGGQIEVGEGIQINTTLKYYIR